MSSLLSLVLELQPTFPGQIQSKPWYGWASQSILLRAIRMAFSSKFSHAMHIDNFRRGYTASSLYPDGDTDEVLNPVARHFLRYTALNEECAQAIISTTRPGQPLCAGSLINLSGLHMNIVGIYVQQLQHPLAVTFSYDTLCDSTVKQAMSLPNRMTLHLESATFFKSTSTGRYHHQPTAALVFGSLYDRWKLFARTKTADLFMDYVNKSIKILDAELIEKEIFGKYVREGVVGQITFQTSNPDSQYWIFAHILARYALFAGVGKETASGFGQCWMLPL